MRVRAAASSAAGARRRIGVLLTTMKEPTTITAEELRTLIEVAIDILADQIDARYAKGEVAAAEALEREMADLIAAAR
jgi:hypothetical protein